MHEYDEFLDRISNLLTSNSDFGCRISCPDIWVDDHVVTVLEAVNPFDGDNRAAFVIDEREPNIMHIAIANACGMCALGMKPPVWHDPDSLSVARWQPAFLRPGQWRTVRLPSSLLVTLIDVPIEPTMPIEDLLYDLEFLTTLQHLFAQIGHVAEFDWNNDPDAEIVSALAFDVYSSLMPPYTPSPWLQEIERDLEKATPDNRHDSLESRDERNPQ